MHSLPANRKLQKKSISSGELTPELNSDNDASLLVCDSS